MNCSAEDRLVLLLSQATLEEDTKSQIKELLKNDLDWSRILRKSELNDTPQLLYMHLNSLKGDDLHLPSHGLLEQFESAYYENCARNVLIYNELTRILVAFKKNGIETILLKGVALARSFYQDAALRPMADIDILIRKIQLDEASGVLDSLGYSLPHNYSNSFKNSCLSLNAYVYRRKYPVRIFIHLHWHLINSTWPIYAYVSGIDMDRIWTQAERIYVDGIEVLLMAPHHLLIYLSEHAFNHSFDRLILFSDILQVIRHYQQRLNWNLLLEETLRFNLTKPVYFCLYFSSKLLNAKIPQEVIHKLKPPRFSFIERRFLSLVLSNNVHSRYLSYFVYLSMQHSLAKKVRFIWSTIFPDPEVLAHNRMINVAQVRPIHYLLRFIRR
jgi:hypothetical protein